MEERVKKMLGGNLKSGPLRALFRAVCTWSRPEMKALMKDLGPDFKFPEWKCAAGRCFLLPSLRYRMNKLDSCSSEV